MEYCQDIRGIKIILSDDILTIIIGGYANPMLGNYGIKHYHKYQTTVISYLDIGVEINYCDEHKLDELIGCIREDGDVDKEFGDYILYIRDTTIKMISLLDRVYPYIYTNRNMDDLGFQLKDNRLFNKIGIYFDIDDDFAARINNGDITIGDGLMSIVEQIANIFKTYGSKGTKSARN